MHSSFPIPVGVPTRLVLAERGAVAALPAVLQWMGIAPGARCVVLCDARTLAAAGEAVEATLARAGYGAMRSVMVDDARGEVAGDELQLADAIRAAAGANVVIGVGAGVLNDLGKLAAHRATKPYVAVATAASMNGYGSPIAAILEHGVKRTLPAAPTLAIIADLNVLAAAPIEMTRSGFADALSKASATADWTLAHLVNDEPYDPRPHELLDPVVRDCQRHAAAIGRAEPAALELLVRALVYGAFAMTLAGHSAPASGGEHLISHLWDMQAHAFGRPHALHGFQVAIGTRVVAALYARLLRLEPGEIDVARLAERWQPWDAASAAAREAHGELWPIVEAEARKQHLAHGQLQQRLARIRGCWDEIRTRLAPLLLTPDDLLALHRTAGVPTEPAAIGQTRASVRHAFLHARDVRARYTVLDLAADLGVLEPWADAVLDDASVR